MKTLPREPVGVLCRVLGEQLHEEFVVELDSLALALGGRAEAFGELRILIREHREQRVNQNLGLLRI